MKFRHWWTILTGIYAVGTAVVLGPDPWMYWVWLGTAIMVALVTLGVFVIRKQLDAAPPKWETIIASGVAFGSFAILAVQSAVLETRGYESTWLVFSALGLGMILVVVCFLSAYDRPKQTPIY
ncbi:MAG: hypothetical protein ACPHK8_02460 [Thermoplasmatota archaeon]